MLAYHSHFSPMHLKIRGIIRSMQPTLWRAPCSATRSCAHERYDTGAAVCAVIRKYRFWCFVNSESGRTRLSCRDSETVVIERLPSDNLLLSLILVDGINASPSAKSRMGSQYLHSCPPAAGMRLRGGQRTWWSSVNVPWSADINFPKHFNANINAFKGTWLSKYIHHNKPYCLINVRVRGRFTLSMLLYSLSTFILRTGGDVPEVPCTHMSCVTCHVSTCDNVSRPSAYRCQGWLLHCGYIHINSDHNLGPCTLYLWWLVAGCNV